MLQSKNKRKQWYRFFVRSKFGTPKDTNWEKVAEVKSTGLANIVYMKLQEVYPSDKGFEIKAE